VVPATATELVAKASMKDRLALGPTSGCHLEKTFELGAAVARRVALASATRLGQYRSSSILKRSHTYALSGSGRTTTIITIIAPEAPHPIPEPVCSRDLWSRRLPRRLALAFAVPVRVN